MAQPFDDRTLVLSGEPVPVAAQLGSFLSNGFFSASNKASSSTGPAAQPVRIHNRPGLIDTGRVSATRGNQGITSA